MLAIKSFFSLILLIGTSNLTYGSLLMDYPFDDLGLWHRRSVFDLIDWDPFDDDQFELDFFHDLSFPRIQWARSNQHMKNPTPLVKRNDKRNYQLAIDVKGFEPKDLSIKLIDRDLLVVGEHTCERKQTRACFRRRFCWRRTLPDDVDTSSLKAALTESNVLEIEAKKSKDRRVKFPLPTGGGLETKRSTIQTIILSMRKL
ncbi:unnamed protein product [Porites evermanni]|uniref:SHSP domain-containing protein n=1 Tax=Porites evermanni TaxID=104178 RepID=A0ABN8RA39_9CNID|nr:unnamed protein product [Porites evermanni]